MYASRIAVVNIEGLDYNSISFGKQVNFLISNYGWFFLSTIVTIIG